MIALTGSTGFVGRSVVAAAHRHDIRLVPLVRAEMPGSLNHSFPITPKMMGGLGAGPIDPEVLSGSTTVIHAAARAHRMGEHGASALAAYRQTNVAGTAALITAMEQAGTRRLLYLSSIKAVGERSHSTPLSPQSERNPEDPYGISKAEAEDVIASACATGRIAATIIRPVLVHGVGAQGNLGRLLKSIRSAAILPFGSVRNRRSFIGVDNLADAILAAATAPWPGGPEARASRVYHLADDGVISTRRLVEVLAEGMGVIPHLISVPRWLAVGGATLLGKGAVARRLFDDLEVDDSDFRRDIAWKPSVGLEDGLRRMAEDYARRMRDGIPT